MATSHDTHDVTSPVRRTLDESSRSSSASSSDTNLVGLLEPTNFFRPIIFNATSKSDSSIDQSSIDPILETPPDSRPNTPDEYETEFDDSRLPALPREYRRGSSPGLKGGEAKAILPPVQPRSKSIAEGLAIPVSLKKIKEAGKTCNRYVLKVDDELRELLAAGARERERHSRGKSGTRPRRGRFGDLVFTQRSTAFDRANNPEGVKDISGFFVLMWLGVFILMMKTAAENYRVSGRIFGVDILSIMFEPNHLFDCLLTDAIMFFGSSLWNVPLQRAVQKDIISWNRSGWILQSIWQFAYLYLIVSYTLYKQWPWIQTVFLVLHCVVMLMKQHSYGFYNGYLSEVYKRRRVLQEELGHVKEAGATTSGTDVLSSNQPYRRKSSVGQLDISHLPEEFTPKQASRFATLLNAEIEACDAELSLEAANSPRVTYPENLTFTNYLEYIHFPTVVYELAYPRSLRIDWAYVAEKTLATFGVLGIMIVVSQQSIYPVVMHCNALHDLPLSERLAEFPWILLQLVFPFMMCYLCVWYLIWELILNLLGELTRFSDRGFYGDWWNSITWDQFARDWNKPVHYFLLRHVYHSSISTFQISREKATLITFLISAVVHELVMWCIFGKLRGYLLFSQMLQLPLVALSRTRFMKGRETLGNVMFWVGIWTGPGFLSASYLIL